MISPTKVGTQVLRHQLQVKTRSMSCVINYGLESVTWMTYFALTTRKVKPAARNHR